LPDGYAHVRGRCPHAHIKDLKVQPDGRAKSAPLGDGDPDIKASRRRSSPAASSSPPSVRRRAPSASSAGMRSKRAWGRPGCGHRRSRWLLVNLARHRWGYAVSRTGQLRFTVLSSRPADASLPVPRAAVPRVSADGSSEVARPLHDQPPLSRWHWSRRHSTGSVRPNGHDAD
jgi:hypothetical protein